MMSFRIKKKCYTFISNQIEINNFNQFNGIIQFNMFIYISSTSETDTISWPADLSLETLVSEYRIHTRQVVTCVHRL